MEDDEPCYALVPVSEPVTLSAASRPDAAARAKTACKRPPPPLVCTPSKRSAQSQGSGQIAEPSGEEPGNDDEGLEAAGPTPTPPTVWVTCYCCEEDVDIQKSSAAGGGSASRICHDCRAAEKCLRTNYFNEGKIGEWKKMDTKKRRALIRANKPLKGKRGKPRTLKAVEDTTVRDKMGLKTSSPFMIEKQFKDRLVEKYGWDEETQNEKWQEALADPKTLRMKDQMGEVVISYLEDVVATAGRSLMHDKGIRRTTEVDEESVDPANLHESLMSDATLAADTGIFSNLGSAENFTRMPTLPGHGVLQITAAKGKAKAKAKAKGKTKHGGGGGSDIPGKPGKPSKPDAELEQLTLKRQMLLQQKNAARSLAGWKQHVVEQLEVSQRFHQDLCELRELLAQRYISLEGFVIEDYLEDEMPLDIINRWDRAISKLSTIAEAPRSPASDRAIALVHARGVPLPADAVKCFSAKFKSAQQSLSNASSSLTAAVDDLVDLEAAEKVPLPEPVQSRSSRSKKPATKAQGKAGKANAGKVAQREPAKEPEPEDAVFEDIVLPDVECPLIESLQEMVEAAEYEAGCLEGQVWYSEKHGLDAFGGSCEDLKLDHSEVLRNSDTVLDAIREAADESRIDCKQRRTESFPNFEQVFACGESKELFAGTSFTATFLRHHQNKVPSDMWHLFERNCAMRATFSTPKWSCFGISDFMFGVVRIQEQGVRGIVGMPFGEALKRASTPGWTEIHNVMKGMRMEDLVMIGGFVCVLQEGCYCASPPGMILWEFAMSQTPCVTINYNCLAATHFPSSTTARMLEAVQQAHKLCCHPAHAQIEAKLKAAVWFWKFAVAASASLLSLLESEDVKEEPKSPETVKLRTGVLALEDASERNGNGLKNGDDKEDAASETQRMEGVEEQPGRALPGSSNPCDKAPESDGGVNPGTPVDLDKASQMERAINPGTAVDEADKDVPVPECDEFPDVKGLASPAAAESPAPELESTASSDDDNADGMQIESTALTKPRLPEEPPKSAQRTVLEDDDDDTDAEDNPKASTSTPFTLAKAQAKAKAKAKTKAAKAKAKAKTATAPKTRSRRR